MSAAPSAAGLAGVVAGETAISTVGKEGKGLTYRGYSIHDLAAHASFDEVAYLLLYGQLPARREVTDFRNRLERQRGLPANLRTVLEQLPPTAHPMDVMRTGCSTPETGGRWRSRRSCTNGSRSADRWTARDAA